MSWRCEKAFTVAVTTLVFARSKQRFQCEHYHTKFPPLERWVRTNIPTHSQTPTRILTFIAFNLVICTGPIDPSVDQDSSLMKWYYYLTYISSYTEMAVGARWTTTHPSNGPSPDPYLSNPCARCPNLTTFNLCTAVMSSASDHAASFLRDQHKNT